MEVYVNECSIHGQYYDQADFDIALQKLYQTLDLLRKQKLTIDTYHSEGWQVYQAIRTTPLVSTLNAVKRRDLRVAFFRILNDGLNAKDWQQTRIHSSDDLYTCNNEIVTDTSMAEAAERATQNIDKHYLLLNFPESKFAGLSLVRILKEEKDETNLDCVDHHTKLQEWLERKYQLSRTAYDYNSKVCPTDAQTILVNQKRFEKTSYRYNERAIYRELATKYY